MLAPSALPMALLCRNNYFCISDLHRRTLKPQGVAHDQRPRKSGPRASLSTPKVILFPQLLATMKQGLPQKNLVFHLPIPISAKISMTKPLNRFRFIFLRSPPRAFPQGVMITAVIIKNVTLPPNISDQMSGKTLVISSQAEQKMNQQYDMQQVCVGIFSCHALASTIFGPNLDYILPYGLTQEPKREGADIGSQKSVRQVEPKPCHLENCSIIRHQMGYRSTNLLLTVEGNPPFVTKSTKPGSCENFHVHAVLIYK